VTDTFKEKLNEEQVEGRVFLLEGVAWLLTNDSKNLYQIENAEFVENCREYVREIEHLTAAAIVRRDRATEHTTGNGNYPDHSYSRSAVTVPMMTVHHGRNSFWAKTPVLCALADQEIGKELDREH
jgi:hypothetical protein